MDGGSGGLSVTMHGVGRVCKSNLWSTRRLSVSSGSELISELSHYPQLNIKVTRQASTLKYESAETIIKECSVVQSIFRFAL